GFEVGERGVVIMRAGGVEHDQVELTVDDRADRPALAPQLVVVEMLVVELEAVRAEELARLDRQGVEIDRAAAYPIEALEHRRDLRRRHVGAELGHLLVGAMALTDHEMAASQA